MDKKAAHITLNEEMNATSKTDDFKTEEFKELISLLSTDEKRALFILMQKLVNKKENEK